MKVSFEKNYEYPLELRETFRAAGEKGGSSSDSSAANFLINQYLDISLNCIYIGLFEKALMYLRVGHAKIFGYGDGEGDKPSASIQAAVNGTSAYSVAETANSMREGLSPGRKQRQAAEAAQAKRKLNDKRPVNILSEIDFRFLMAYVYSLLNRQWMALHYFSDCLFICS